MITITVGDGILIFLLGCSVGCIIGMELHKHGFVCASDWIKQEQP